MSWPQIPENEKNNLLLEYRKMRSLANPALSGAAIAYDMVPSTLLRRLQEMDRVERSEHSTEQYPRVVGRTPSPSARFPDKKISAERSFEDVLEQIRKVQHYAEGNSPSQDEAIWVPAPDYPELPIAVSWMPDVHFGSLDVDYDLLQKHLDVIQNTPNMYVCFGGDEIDNFNAGKYPEGIWHDGVSPEQQMYGWADILTRLDDAEKIGSMTWGNHTEFSAMAGINPFSTFFKHVSCPLFVDGGGVLNVQHGDVDYRLGMRHTFWGTSKLNLTNSPKRMMQFWRSDLDAAFVGHVHYAAGEDFYNAGRQQIACVGGTYKLMDGFRKRWVGDPQPGGFTILLYPDAKKMALCRYPEDAQDILLGKIARIA